MFNNLRLQQTLFECLVVVVLSGVHCNKLFLCFSVAYSKKTCNSDGTWFRHPETDRVWTNYTMCYDHSQAEVSAQITWLRTNSFELSRTLGQWFIFELKHKSYCGFYTVKLLMRRARNFLRTKLRNDLTYFQSATKSNQLLNKISKYSLLINHSSSKFSLVNGMHAVHHFFKHVGCISC